MSTRYRGADPVVVPGEDRLEQFVRRLQSPAQLKGFLLLMTFLVLAIGLSMGLLFGSYYVTIGLVVGILGFLGIAIWPYTGVLLMLALLYLRPEEKMPQLVGLRLPLTVSFLTLIVWVLQMMAAQKVRLAHLPQNRLMVGFMGAIVLSTLPLFYPTFTVDAAMEVAKLLLLYGLIVNLVDTPGRVRFFLGLLVAFSVYVAFDAIHFYYQGLNLSEGDRTYGSGIFNDPNDLAQVLVVAIPFALNYLFARRAPIANMLGGAPCIILLYAIYLTDSRGGFLALLVALVAHFRKLLGRSGLLVGGAVLVLLLLFAPSRMDTVSTEEGSAQGRIQAWSAGIQMLKTNPLLGVGYRQFTQYHERTAHNSFVLCFAETGLLGFFFWIGLLYATMKMLTSIQKAESAGATFSLDPTVPKAIQTALIGYLTAAFFLSRTYNPVLYLLIGIAGAACLVMRQEHPIEFVMTRRDTKMIWAICIGGVSFTYVFVRLFAIWGSG